MLPTPDAYNDAVQTPRLAFSDPILAAGTVDRNGFGIPKALGGGFAITYRVNDRGRAFAVRCFHKEVHDLQDRYRLIHSGLRATKLSPFVEFEYQQCGIRVKGSAFPIVKMEWISGTTLGEYIEMHYGNRQEMERLRSQFAALEQDLARHGLAHGDLQNGNVLVDKTQLRLVDYDGMFVSGMPLGKGTELGHKHFQHPLRRATDFGPDIDRFSFIVIDLSLWARCIRPELFKQFSTGENILFSANDYAFPDSSKVFQTLAQVRDPAFQSSLADFACVCKADFKSVPRLQDFLSRKSIPKQAAAGPSVVAPDATAYIGALPVLDAGSFESVCQHIGDRVEMVGQVVEVKAGSTRRGKPYVFINFRHWRDKCVKATIWSEGLTAFGDTPDASWVGQWIVVNGMIDPVYHGKNRYKTISYVSVGPTVTDRSQIRMVSQEEALWHLGKGPRGIAAASAKQVKVPDKNAAVLAKLRGTNSTEPWPQSSAPGNALAQPQPKTVMGTRAPGTITGQSPVRTRNEQVLLEMNAGPTSGTPGPQGQQKKGCARFMAMMLVGFLAIMAYTVFF
jgi:hypothetical protein